MKLPFKMILKSNIEKWRHDTFLGKEPETIEWIKSFNPNNVFFDIGSNIGIYALYAASLYPDYLIYAFEPVRMNYIRLMQNIEMNKFDNIIALPIAVYGITRIDKMQEIDNKIGHSGSLINSCPDKIVQKEYLLPAITIDDFVDTWGVEPNHIKIDIDSGEYNLIIKSARTLRCSSIKSCLIEVNSHRSEICKIMQGCGFTGNNKFNKLPNHSRHRRQQEEGNTAENIIFTRESLADLRDITQDEASIMYKYFKRKYKKA